MRRIHQLLPAFLPRDAISQVTIELQWLLRRSGLLGSIYANDIAKGFERLAHPTSQLSPQRDDLLLYHHAGASELAGRFLHYRCHRGVVCHNLAPSRSETRASIASTLSEGHAQLAAMARHLNVSIATSKFHAEGLAAAGHQNVHTVPWFVEPARFAPDSINAALFKKLKRPGALLVLALGPLGTQQRLEDVLSLHREIQRTHRDVRTLIVDDSKGQLTLRLFKIPSQVSLLRNPTHAERVAAYHAADVFISMSEHEGFSVRLLEAMAAEVPVLAFACAGVPETLGGYGIGFDEKHFGGLSELVLRLRDDLPLRERIIEGQRKRVAQLSPENTTRELMSALDSIPAPTRSLPSNKQNKRRRIALVVQRYGANITGGAESHARHIAQRLAPHAEVTVLTTTAQNHLTWADAYAEGLERDAHVRVMRFSCGGQRAMRAFNRLSRQTFKENQSRMLEERWIAEQGPKAPGLLAHIADHAQHYDAFIFFTYLYAPTIWGLPLVAQRALLVPTAHDEPPLRFGAYADAFALPRVLLCNTIEESRLIEARFPKAGRRRVVGVGIDVPKDSGKRWRPVKEPYLLYLGRREAGKGLPELVSHHRWLTQTQSRAPTLVFAGDGDWKVSARNTHVQGRISEAEKFDALREALAVVVPSRLESLSLVTLEAFACGTPVIGNAASEVVQGHLTRSKAGFSYSDRESYVDAVAKVQSERKDLTQKAFLYSRQFRWEKVIEAYQEELERIFSR